MLANIAFFLNSPSSPSFKELPIPELNDGDVLVEVKRTGICGSDLHLYYDGRNGGEVVTEPIVLGHESSGIIMKVGGKIDNSRIGERVAIEPWAVCRVCEFCQSGRYQLCPNCSDFVKPRRGTLARYFKVPSEIAYTLPANLDLEDGALVGSSLHKTTQKLDSLQMEPMAVAVHVVSKVGELRAGQTVAVFGCGPVGLLIQAVAQALGASKIIAVDNNAARLDFASRYTSAEVFMPPSPDPGESKMDYSERASAVFRESYGFLKPYDGVDLVIDASGAETCIQMAFHVAKAGGTFVQLGYGSNYVPIPIPVLLQKELKMRGSNRYGPGDYPVAIALAASGKVNLKPLVTQRFDFKDVAAAFEATKAGKDADGKMVLKAMISGVPDE